VTKNVTHYTVINNRIVNNSIDVKNVERVTRRPVVVHRVVDDDLERARGPRVREREVVIARPAVVRERRDRQDQEQVRERRDDADRERRDRQDQGQVREPRERQEQEQVRERRERQEQNQPGERRDDSQITNGLPWKSGTSGSGRTGRKASPMRRSTDGTRPSVRISRSKRDAGNKSCASGKGGNSKNRLAPGGRRMRSGAPGESNSSKRSGSRMPAGAA
jgi:hypothetical protein